MTEVQSQACVYTTADRSDDPKQELANMKFAIINETVSGLTKTTCGPYAKPETIYTNNGGGLLMKQLRESTIRIQALEFGQHALEDENATSRHLRRTTAYARRRFFTQSISRSRGRKLGRREKIAILEGNYAVHCGDLVTDAVLFKLGELKDHEEFKRLYGVEPTEALTIECTSIIDAINKRASIIAEYEKDWIANPELETGFQQVLEFGRTASADQLAEFEGDDNGSTGVSKSWFTIMDCPYPDPQSAPRLDI